MGKYLLDQYSLLHYAVGVVAFFLDIRLSIALAIHIVFEVAENSTRVAAFLNTLPFWPGGKAASDSLLNTTTDNVVFVLGWFTAWGANALAKNYGIHSEGPTAWI